MSYMISNPDILERYYREVVVYQDTPLLGTFFLNYNFSGVTS